MTWKFPCRDLTAFVLNHKLLPAGLQWSSVQSIPNCTVRSWYWTELSKQITPTVGAARKLAWLTTARNQSSVNWKEKYKTWNIYFEEMNWCFILTTEYNVMSPLRCGDSLIKSIDKSRVKVWRLQLSMSSSQQTWTDVLVPVSVSDVIIPELVTTMDCYCCP